MSNFPKAINHHEIFKCRKGCDRTFSLWHSRQNHERWHNPKYVEKMLPKMSAIGSGPKPTLRIPKSPEVREKISQANKGSLPWNKGLTKDDHPSLMEVSRKLKGRKPWLKGLSKETDERVFRMGKSVSEARIGIEPWNKGLNGGTDERLKRIGEKISVALKEQWKNPEYRRKHKGGGYEGEFHSLVKNLIVKTLNAMGIDLLVDYEHWVTTNNRVYKVDVFVCIEENLKIAIEIGKCTPSKLRDLKDYYDFVLNVPKALESVNLIKNFIGGLCNVRKVSDCY